MKLIFWILILLLNCLDSMAAVISLPIPRSTIQFTSPEIVDQGRPLYFRFGMTSWVPNSLKKSSRLSNTTEFKPVQDTHLQVEIGKEFYNSARLSARSAVGFSYAQLERSGELNNGGAVTHYAETLNIFQFPASVEFLGQIISFPKFHPLFKLGLSPVYSRAPSGPFATGVSEINLLAMSSIGFSFDLGNKSEYSWLSSSSFALGLERSQAIDANSFTGEGVWISFGLNLQ